MFFELPFCRVSTNQKRKNNVSPTIRNRSEGSLLNIFCLVNITRNCLRLLGLQFTAPIRQASSCWQEGCVGFFDRRTCCWTKSATTGTVLSRRTSRRDDPELCNSLTPQLTSTSRLLLLVPDHLLPLEVSLTDNPKPSRKSDGFSRISMSPELLAPIKPSQKIDIPLIVTFRPTDHLYQILRLRLGPSQNPSTVLPPRSPHRARSPSQAATPRLPKSDCTPAPCSSTVNIPYSV